MTTAPDNFDWVTARSKCSLEQMFDVLMKEAQANMAARNELLGHSGDRNRFEFNQADPRLRKGFTISDTWAQTRRAVDIAITKGAIQIMRSFPDRGPLPMVVTVTLNDEGDCRFKMADEEELDTWQVLKRALEALFFDPSAEN
jgi:hypothetical protein